MGTTTKKRKQQQKYTKLKLSPQDILADYKLGWISRHVSLVGRKEVLTGKAKFGIFGAGKEIPQIVVSKFFQDGDFRSGYYRDQTFMLAAGLVTVEQLFAQLYAHPSMEHDPHSGGRQMNAHFATDSVDEYGRWKALTEQKNTTADISSTASQMARAIGLALASKKFREIPALSKMTQFSKDGNEITFSTIGDASTSEGLFFEAVNAAGVLEIPLTINIWDDGYGISVPTKYQTTKGDISEALRGFEIDKNGSGYLMYKAKAWDYEGMIKIYSEGIPKVRKNHTPAIFHIKDVTQPQGHSTSGSHQRYKNKERLAWEKEFDCLVKMRTWMLEKGIASSDALDQIEKEAEAEVKMAKTNAWNAYRNSIKVEQNELFAIYQEIETETGQPQMIEAVKKELSVEINPFYKDVLANAKKMLFQLRKHPNLVSRQKLLEWKNEKAQTYQDFYSTHLYSETDENIFNVEHIPPKYGADSPYVTGFQLLNKCFDAAFTRDPRLLAFGEDVGHIGDVNQGFAGLQEKHGIERIFDTGIREATIIGQGIGLALRGLRPIAEIQYLDYFVYGIQPITDDLATLQYRTVGKQKAPLIVRTRGHRLEGIWHAGSPIAFILNSCRGVRFLVPRDMTRAAGFYNALLQTDEPAIIIECLNAYRLKEQLPDNIDTMTTPFGIPEVLQEGNDITLVSYGSCIRIIESAIPQLKEVGISCELIDVQSLLPFDIEHRIVESIKKTNRVLFIDEDVPGGATAYMMQKVIEEQNAYRWLDAAPQTLSAQEHRTAYGSDGDYFSKPNKEDVFEAVYAIMHEADPSAYPMFY